MGNADVREAIQGGLIAKRSGAHAARGTLRVRSCGKTPSTKPHALKIPARRSPAAPVPQGGRRPPPSVSRSSLLLYPRPSTFIRMHLRFPPPSLHLIRNHIPYGYGRSLLCVLRLFSARSALKLFISLGTNPLGFASFNPFLIDTI